MCDPVKPLRADDLEKQCTNAATEQHKMQTDVNNGCNWPRCRRIYRFAVPGLCVWCFLVTIIAFPFIAVKVYERSTVVLLGRVNNLTDEVAHLRHGHAVFADALRELNQSHEAQREMDVKINDRVTELEDDVNTKYESLNQRYTEIEEKLTHLDHKLDDEISELTQQITHAKSKSNDIARQAAKQQQILDNLNYQIKGLKGSKASGKQIRNSAKVLLPTTMMILACLLLAL